MKDPVLIVRFTVVDREDLMAEHVAAKTLAGLHLHRMYVMREVAQSVIPIGVRIAQESDKFWESAMLMGALDT